MIHSYHDSNDREVLLGKVYIPYVVLIQENIFLSRLILYAGV
jgi:hypothetical protein